MPRTAIEIPLIPQPGEIWFYVDLALIDDVLGLYELLAELNITPKIAYTQTREGIEVALLLAYERREHMPEPPDDFYWKEQQALANAIDTEAIHCRFRRTVALQAA